MVMLMRIEIRIVAISVRDGGVVVVVDDDDDFECVTIIKQIVMLVQAFAGFLLCYVIGQCA